MFLTGHLQEILAPSALTTVFQPIFDISGESLSLTAFEALTRGPAGTHFEIAAVLFDYIRLKRAEVAADRLCVANAFRSAAALPIVPLLSVNVHATTVESDGDFPAFVAAAARETGIDASRVVVEIVEQPGYRDEHGLRRSLAELRALGVRIAVDDLGLGNGNYRLILDSRPEYLKIDRYFVHGCADDPYRRSLLKSIVQLGVDCRAAVIAEGIERSEDLAVLRALGVGGGQGYLLGRPAAPASFHPRPFAVRGGETNRIRERTCS